MISILEITEDNLDEFKGKISDEHLVNIPREYCFGLLGIMDGENNIGASIFWELKNAEREDMGNQAIIQWFSAENKENADLLLDAFVSRIRQDETEEACFELKELQEHEKTALEEHGFTLEHVEGTNVIVTIKDLEKLSYITKEPPRYIKKISDISNFQFKAGIMNAVLHDRYGLLDDLPFLPRNWYEPSVSCCVTTDDKVTGLLLVHQIKKERHRIELLFAEKLDASINVLNMIRFSVQAVMTRYAPEDEIVICRHNTTVTNLAKKMFPEIKGELVFRGLLKLR